CGDASPSRRSCNAFEHLTRRRLGEREPMDLDAYCAWLAEAGLDAPWSRPGPLIQAKSSCVEACVWRWDQIEPRLSCSPQFVVPGRGAERRILRLANPGVPERTSAHTLSGAIQYLLPGDTAPPHRHTP